MNSRSIFLPGAFASLGALLLGWSAAPSAWASHGYADSTWPSVHGDSSNTNSMPLVAPAYNIREWSSLSSAAVAAGPVLDEQGTLWVTTGRGKGYPCLHRLDRDGNILWESEAYERASDLDSLAVMGAARIDESGDVYVADKDQLWAFHPSATDLRSVSIKWVVSLPSSRWPVGSQYAPFFVDDAVGVFALPGTLAVYRRDNGTLAAPVMELPGEISTLEDADSLHDINVVTESYAASGLLDPEVVSLLLGAGTGVQWVLTNTPAVHPDTDEIFISGLGALLPSGEGTSALYVVEADLASKSLEVTQSVDLGVGNHASSPAISPDGSQIVVVGDDSTVHAIDAQSLSEEWTFEQSEARGTSAVAIGMDGTIYHNGVTEVVAIDPSGTELWRTDFAELAESMLTPMFAFRDPSMGTWDPMFTNERLALIMHVAAVSADHVWVAPVMGYGVDQNPLDSETATVPTPELSMLIPLDPATGKISGPMYELPEVADGHIVLDRDGTIYVTHLAALSTVFYYGIDELVPKLLRTDDPVGGITALEPGRFKEQVYEGLSWSATLDSKASGHVSTYTSGGGGGSLSDAVKALTVSAAQLEASATTLVDPHAEGELCSTQVQNVINAIYGTGSASGALTEINSAIGYLTQATVNTSAAQAAISRANSRIQTAQSYIPLRPQIVTSLGSAQNITLIGNEKRAYYGDLVEEYLGIPYAEPPTGNLRWKRPVAKVWQSGTVEDTGDYGQACLQADGAGESMTVRGSEDCLTLNVYRPKKDMCSGQTDGARPVMVWVHGGGWINGDAMRYNGFRLATSGDVVVVTVQYRLGPLGFLALPELIAEDPNGSTGNYGHLDILLALKWVQDNISKFGGDPNNVTLFGQSAGGGITCSIAASPLTYSLYGKPVIHKAIMQSGTCSAALVMGSEDSSDVDSAIYRSKAVVAAVDNCQECQNPTTRLAALRKVSGDEIVLALAQVSDETEDTFYTFPAIDGYYLNGIAGYKVQSGAAHNIPVILGANEDEGSLLAAPYVTPIRTWNDFKSQVTRVVGATQARKLVIPLYQGQFTEPDKAYQALWEDFIFTCPAMVNANHFRKGGSRAYAYGFYADPHTEDFTFGAFHGLEVYYIWDYNELLNSDIGPLGDGDYDLIDTLQAAWTSFARTGTPSMNPAWNSAADTAMSLDVEGSARETMVLKSFNYRTTSYRGGRCKALEPVFKGMDTNGDQLPDISIFRLLKPQ